MRILHILLRPVDFAFIFLAVAMLMFGLFSITIVPEQSSTQVAMTQTSMVTLTAISTSTFGTNTTVTQVSAVSSTVTSVSYTTEEFLVTTTAPYLISGVSTVTVVFPYVVYSTASSSTTYSQVLSSQSSIQLTSIKQLTKLLISFETVTALNPWFVIDVLIPSLIGVVVFGGAFVRVHAYRTRLHIYHEILQYVAEGPKIPSHIMRRCNLETRKFSKYMGTLQERGFVQKARDDGDHYLATDKARDYLRDPKLSAFIQELP